MKLYGNLRLLYNNFVASDNIIEVSSQATGRITGVSKDGEGTAVLELSGDFSSNIDLNYTLEIDSVAGGKEVGESTFKWKTDKTLSGYEESNVLTITDPPYTLSADGLNSNIAISFIGGVGNDFELGDKWAWYARAVYGKEKLLDYDRDTFLKTSGISAEYIVIDLTESKNVTAIIIYDNNFSENATVTIEANTSNLWTSPLYSYTFSTISDSLYLYLDQTYQYWRITISDTLNADGYIKIGQLYLGDHKELNQPNAIWGSGRTDSVGLVTNESESGYRRAFKLSKYRTLELEFGEAVKDEDIQTFLSLQDRISSVDSGKIIPLFVHLFSDSPDDLALMEWLNIDEFAIVYSSYLLHSGINIQFKEVVKT